MNRFLCSLRNLELLELDETEIEILPGLKLSNQQTIKDLYLSEQVIAAIGIIETEHILNSHNFLYYEYDEADYRDLDNKTYLLTILIWLEELIKNSWLVKDNCIDCDYAVLGKGIDTERAEYSSNSLVSKRTLANGGIETVTFNRQELEQLEKLHDKIENYLSAKKSSSLTFMLDKNFSRVGRSLAFIKLARSSSNLAYKISNYCSALETLLTTDTSELSHKLSERVAFILEDIFPNKLQTFGHIKTAYNVRSKLTHGDTLKASLIDQLPNLSISCDNYLRAIINKIINQEELLKVFDGSNDAIDDYFQNLIFK